jgi:hypothetical protein
MSEVHAIPTVYKGIEFRSRLEAKWAAVFDQLEWSWEYEPIDLKGYIPDFVLQWREPTIVEIKPAMTIKGLDAAKAKIERSGWDHDAMILGGTTFELDGLPIIGLLSERCDPQLDDGNTWWWSEAPFVICHICQKPNVYHYYGAWGYRACDCGFDKYCDYAPKMLRHVWKNATNTVKYRQGAR